MSTLQVEAVEKRLGATRVLRGVDLTVPSGAVLALLGGSGSGKTTLLRLIAGFDPADAGRIVLGERVLEAPGTHVPAERRHIGYVPQEGTLFPHLTVAGNVGFGLNRAERRQGRIAEALRLTGLEELAARYPHALSGGQQQRTALARALAPRPGLILLDEPFNALDLALRRAVCADVAATLRASGATAILVTHDPDEAFASADLVAVMQDGRIDQRADPETLYRRPLSPEIARLTGPTLFLDAVAEAGQARTVLGLLALQPDAPKALTSVMLRPEQVLAVPPGAGVPARLLNSVFRGDHVMARVAIDGITLDLRLSGPGLGTDALHLQVQGGVMGYAAGDG